MEIAEATDLDREFFERELASFVPDRVFDAHCHLWQPEHLPPETALNLPTPVGYDECLQWTDCLHPGRLLAALFLPAPFVEEQLGHANEWIGRNVARDASCRGLFIVKPKDDPEWVRQEVKRLGLHGFKCYHLFAAASPTWEADVPAYLPEPLVKVANDEGWVITLHLVKAHAVADPSNIQWIRRYCETYPNMTLILAHSARGFQPAHNLEGLPQLVGLDNLYFDSSANCEPIAHEAVIRIFGHKKLMYGSDFFVSHLRGRSVAAADSFLFLYQDSPVWGEKHMQITPLLIGMENLRSLKWACWSQRLNDTAVEDIFWNNAAKLFGLE